MKRGLRALLALVLGSAAALALAEGVLRWLRPGMYDRPLLVSADGTASADLSEVVGFLASAAGDGQRTSLTQLAAGFVLRGCYDRPAWDYFDADGCVEYRTNSLGFRDDEFPLARPPDEYRVLALGDSFTFGIGVGLGDSWPQILERRLAVERGTPVQVVNAGFAKGHMPPHYAPWALREGLLVQPQLVIAGLCLNDLGDIPMMAYNFDPPASGSALLDLWRRVRGRRAVDAALERQRTDPAAARRFDFLRTIQRDPKVWAGTGAALVALRDGLRERGIGLVVAVLPMLSQLRGENPYAPVHATVVAFCAEQGIEVVDLLPALAGRVDTDLWAHPTDQHPNDRGQALLAEGILAYLRGRDG